MSTLGKNQQNQFHLPWDYGVNLTVSQNVSLKISLTNYPQISEDFSYIWKKNSWVVLEFENVVIFCLLALYLSLLGLVWGFTHNRYWINMTFSFLRIPCQQLVQLAFFEQVCISETTNMFKYIKYTHTSYC